MPGIRALKWVPQRHGLSLQHDLGKALHLQVLVSLCNRNNTDLPYEWRSTDERPGHPSVSSTRTLCAPPLPKLLTKVAIQETPQALNMHWLCFGI